MSGRVQAEYIWMDGTQPTSKLRSKTRILENPPDLNPTSFPDWGFDGSSTGQAEGHNSDCVLHPVCVVSDPIRPGEDFSFSSGSVSLDTSFSNYLVLCEVLNPDGTPHPTNTRAELRRVLSSGASEIEPWFGIEQEYTLFSHDRNNGELLPLGFHPSTGEPAPQGPYYCGVGSVEISGRPLIEEHTAACLRANLLIAGTNAEVMPGQWEFQIGAGDPLKVSDHLWLARWLLSRLGEDHNIHASLDPKPALGDWNGAGSHTNFSSKNMRMKDNPQDPTGICGMAAIKAACLKMAINPTAHIAVYGHGIEKRLTGKHETCSHEEFRWGIADRGASIRIPRHVAEQGHGYLEDRRPCANADPYVVCARILKTVCDID